MIGRSLVEGRERKKRTTAGACRMPERVWSNFFGFDDGVCPLRGNDSLAVDSLDGGSGLVRGIFYQEAFFTPGMRPAEAISRNWIREMPN